MLFSFIWDVSAIVDIVGRWMTVWQGAVKRNVAGKKLAMEQKKDEQQSR